MPKMILKKEDYPNIVNMLINGELLIFRKEVLLGKVYPVKVLRYPFFFDGVEHHVKTSQLKDKILSYAKRNNLIFEK